MESEAEKKTGITRKKFLQMCGTVAAGGAILGATGFLVRKKSLVSQDPVSSIHTTSANPTKLVSPYKLVASFSVPDTVKSIATWGVFLAVATKDHMYVYDRHGTPVRDFDIQGEVRDMAIEEGLLYVLLPTQVHVLTLDGILLRAWNACSDESDYCALALAAGNVFVTDVALKNICKYTTDGHFVQFIQSPNGFVIPSYSFGITCLNESIYCSNPGRHCVERYSYDGAFIEAFGKAGGAEGLFCGCCNPVYLAHTPAGDLITSEKGKPRVSCYSQEGEFRSVLLDSEMLGGGFVAYDIQVAGDTLFAAGQNLVTLFQYDKTAIAQTACAACRSNCPLREGLVI